jgi:retron-type reverse transcriptase
MAQKRTPGGWRPITLLSAVGKVIETAIGRRIADAAESHQLLPEGQMGNRRERSTELAIRMVTDTVYTAWLHQMITSLLQLDIKGAFDTVNHIRLLDTMRRKRFPPWVVRWLRSYLDNRTVRLRFDGEESGDIPIIAGVPQGSPLSPILFILYIATLSHNKGWCGSSLPCVRYGMPQAPTPNQSCYTT